MIRRSFRHVLLAVLAIAAGLTIVFATGGGTAGAVAVHQPVDCGIGGTQTLDFESTSPATVTQGSTFAITLDSGGGTADGAEIKNIVSTFQAPTGTTLVAGSAQVGP